MQYKVFGCKVNKYYTDKWLNSEYLADKTGTFVASCVVTDSAKRKWVRFVKKELQNISGKQKIYISGCGAFKDGKAQDDFFTLYPDLAESQEKIEVLDEEPETPSPNPSLTGGGKLEATSPLLGGDREGGSKEREQKSTVIPAKAGISHEGKTGVSENRFLLSQEGRNTSKINLSKLKQAQSTQIYTKKFILIQGGCDSFCTFCLTVQKRGRHYYRSAQDIVEEIVEFEQSGGKEVVLTGVNLSAWGLDNTHQLENFSSDVIKDGKHGGNQSRFAELLRYILENTKIPRIRISSLGPEFITDEVVEICSQERIYPHFHFSIQSGSSNVLRSMARHYDGVYMQKLLTKFRNVQRDDGVNISLGADIIVGFPGETQQDFEDTYNLVKDFKITKLHAFPFSAHTMGESVPAGKFKEQVDEKTKKERMNRLLELGEEIRQEFIDSQKGKTLKVLIEKCSPAVIPAKAGISKKDTAPLHSDGFLLSQEGRKWSGWSENYIECNESNFEVLSGEVMKNEVVMGRLI